jgi:hypothetical protein
LRLLLLLLLQPVRRPAQRRFDRRDADVSAATVRQTDGTSGAALNRRDA